MARLAAWFVILLVLAGCRAPMPSFKLFAPVGPSRVPPPATGSSNPVSPYYQKSAQPSATPPTGLGQRSATPWAPAGPAGESASAVASAQPAVVRSESAAVGDSQVRLASGEAPVRFSTPHKPSDLGATRLRGMPVNDATKVGEPNLLEAPAKFKEISDLPQPTARASAPLSGVAGARRSD
jgi:hypothetical protein